MQQQQLGFIEATASTIRVTEQDSKARLTKLGNLNNSNSGDAFDHWLFFLTSRIISSSTSHMSEKCFGNDLGSASTCCAMDVECKGSELEPWGKALSFWWKVYLSLQKKWPSEFALSPRIYVMGSCKASILRDAHSHERHWIFPFLVFRLRLVRLALVADIHSCSRSTRFWWYTCPAKDVILVHIFVRIVHWLSTQYVYFLINMHLESIDVLNGDQAGLQLRPRFAESKPIIISIEQNCGWSVSWSWQVIDLTMKSLPGLNVKVNVHAESSCDLKWRIGRIAENCRVFPQDRSLHGYFHGFMRFFPPFVVMLYRGNAEAWGGHLRSAGVHQRGAKLCTFWIWDIFRREHDKHDFDIL